MPADVTSQKIELLPPGAESSRHVGTAPGVRHFGDVTMLNGEHKECPHCGELHPVKLDRNGHRCWRCPVKRSEYGRKYRRQNPQPRNKESEARWVSQNMDKRRVYAAIANAMATGRLVRQPCSVCGCRDSHAHHEDYNRRFDVVWLCKDHHGERHREINAAGGFKEKEYTGFSFCRANGAVRRTLHIRRVAKDGISVDSLCGRVEADHGYDLDIPIRESVRGWRKVCGTCHRFYLGHKGNESPGGE